MHHVEKFTSTLMLGTTTNGLGVVGCLPRADMYFWRVNDPQSHRQIMVLYTTYDTSGSIEQRVFFRLLKLARLSAGMASDAAFARQLKRKFV